LIRKLGVVLYCLLHLWLSSAHAQAPVTNFSATPTSGCGPLGVYFKDLSTNSPTFWSWDFGNGQTSSLQNPVAAYITAGTYTVTLIARNTSGADAMRKTDYITVFPYPQASFTSNLTLACAPANVQFTDNSTPGQGSITSWAWSFGDGTSSNQQSPAHSYSQPGYYNVSLTVQNSGGCSNTASVVRYLRVVDGIQPNFVFNQTSTACSAPFAGTLLNQTAGPGTLSYNWTIGNGAAPANSTATNPGVTFPTVGTYDITLQVSSSLGCSQSILQPLALNNGNAIINGPTTVCVNSPATFTNGSAPTPPSVTWTFGDGTGSNASSPSKTWSTIGTYALKLVNNYKSCSNSTTENISVIGPTTPAFAATPTSACTDPLTVSFTDQTSPTPSKWLWNFGDGQTSTQQNPTHTYTAAGTFNVTLTITNAGSCSASTTKNAFVTIQAPTVTIDGTLAACVNNTGAQWTINPAANANAVDGVASYAWTATGSNQGSSTTATPSFTYNSSGTFPITLTITTTGGCTANASATAIVGTSVPADFTATPPPICGNTTVTFTPTNKSTTYTYFWNFGDLDTLTGGSPPSYAVTHRYQKISPPPFPVTLTLTSNGCPTESAAQTITVNPPIANFGYNITCNGGGNYTASFIDSTLTGGDADTYTWNYGDAPGTVSGPGPYLPPHTYAAPGTYTVTLMVIDPTTGCPSTVTKNIVLVAVNPSFTIDNNTPCEFHSFTLTSTSTTNPTSTGFIALYTWTAGPNTVTDSSDTYSVALNALASYTTGLTVTDINGCTYAAANQRITVTGPIVQFADPVIGGGCKNQAVTFQDLSIAYAGSPGPPTAPASPITTWAWNFGDGTTSIFTAPPFTHTYADTGTYTVTLEAIDGASCASTFSLPIQITSPIANFSGPDSFYCPGVPLTFIDSSQGYDPLNDTWSFGNGTPISNTPVTTYPSNGTYNVTLTATDKYNCTTSITKPVSIQSPIAAFNIYDTTTICIPLETIFAAHTQYSDSLYWDFGDGTTSTLDSTSHFYNAMNTFTATLYAEGPGGCFASTSRKIYVEDPNALTSLNYNPLTHCDSINVQFAITPPAYTNFILEFGDNTADSSGNTTPSHEYHNPGDYGPGLIITDATGCIVGVEGNQGIFILGAIPFFSVDKHAFCDSSVVNFTDYTISDDGLASETYNFGDGSPTDGIAPGTGTFNATHDYNQPGILIPKLTVTTTNNCTETYTDTIRVYQTPHPLISTSSLLCTGLIQFNGNLTAPQVDTINWAWNFGNNQQSSLQNPSVDITPGTYSVTLQTSTSFGCKADTSASITIFAPPSIKGPPEVTAPVGIPVTLPMTYSANIVSFAWTPASDLDCPTCANPAATLLYSAEYYVTVTDDNSCTATDSIFVKTICNSQNYFLPNTFSPNGDGVNDYFYPRGTSLYNVRSLTIFNRWGQMVFLRRDFSANVANMGWDGTFGGKPAPADAYVYIIEVVCDNSQVVAIHGSVTLVR
jgi:gliding motility-associated-like protein